MLFNDLQFLKAPPPRYVRFSGNLIFANFLSFLNALPLISLIVSGKFTSSRDEILAKASPRTPRTGLPLCSSGIVIVLEFVKPVA